MATNYPEELDELTNPSIDPDAPSYEDTLSHAAQHANANDAIEALQTKVGKDSDTNADSHDFKLSGVASGDKALSDADGAVAAANIADDAITLEKIVAAARTSIMSSAYPIGSIYINATDNTNPATLLGFGTWTAFGAGRVPVGFNASDTNFDTAEETGGAKTHTLTADEMPAHTHGATVAPSGAWDPEPAVQVLTYFYESGTTYGYLTTSAGGGGAHNNLQPYITVYMWKRTA